MFEIWAKILSGYFSWNGDFHDLLHLLHTENLRHGTDGFTSPPKEGVLRIFFALIKSDVFGRVWTPRTAVTEASTLTPRSPNLVYVVFICKQMTMSLPKMLVCGSHLLNFNVAWWSPVTSQFLPHFHSTLCLSLDESFEELLHGWVFHVRTPYN